MMFMIFILFLLTTQNSMCLEGRVPHKPLRLSAALETMSHGVYTQSPSGQHDLIQYTPAPAPMPTSLPLSGAGTAAFSYPYGAQPAPQQPAIYAMPTAYIAQHGHAVAPTAVPSNYHPQGPFPHNSNQNHDSCLQAIQALKLRIVQLDLQISTLEVDNKKLLRDREIANNRILSLEERFELALKRLGKVEAQHFKHKTTTNKRLTDLHNKIKRMREAQNTSARTFRTPSKTEHHTWRRSAPTPSNGAGASDDELSEQDAEASEDNRSEHGSDEEYRRT